MVPLSCTHDDTETGSSAVRPHWQRLLFFLFNFKPACLLGKPQSLHSSPNLQYVEETNTLEKQELVILRSKQIFINTCISTQKTFHPTCLIESLANLNIGTPEVLKKLRELRVISYIYTNTQCFKDLVLHFCISNIIKNIYYNHPFSIRKLVYCFFQKLLL